MKTCHALLPSLAKLRDTVWTPRASTLSPLDPSKFVLLSSVMVKWLLSRMLVVSFWPTLADLALVNGIVVTSRRARLTLVSRYVIALIAHILT